mmetsp:Transcript_1714/g.3128  ORF Transcript_1714/g.3128 Transcript_1714/m.3128 type:complete len:406 (+) Transcript_1714:145-1362(+)
MIVSSRYSNENLRMSIMTKVLFLVTACLSFDAVVSKETISATTLLSRQHQQRQQHYQEYQRLLVESSLEKCTENLVEAASNYEFLFSQEAFLEFLQLQSGGSFVQSAFDTAALGLVHEYWIVTCTVKQGDCTNGEPMTIYDFLNYQDASGNNNLVEDFCARINDKLAELITPAPTMISSTMPSLGPTVLPTVHPSSKPTVHPSAGPSARPSSHPSLGPTTFPSAAPVSTPSSRPSTRPSLTPTLSKAPTLHPSPSPTLSSRPTDIPTASPSRLYEPSDYPSMHPTATPTYLDSFTLTFSVGYNVTNPEEVMIQWTEDVAYPVLETFDSNCARDSNTFFLCPLTLRVTVFFIVRPCSSFGSSFKSNTCALADLTVSLSSLESFDGGILNAINQSVRDRINELADIL